ncbi:MAG: ACP phosphodiesterase [Pseudomonadales bacterium]
MNYLAHFHLAGEDPGLITGALLGDFVKGTVQGETFAAGANFAALPTRTREGILLHRAIDAYFDTLPSVREFRDLLYPQHRRLHGIALDLLFDHLLSLNWNRFHDCELDLYSDAISELLLNAETHFSPDARQFSRRLREHRLLLQYRQPATILLIAGRIASRWGREQELCGLLESMLADSATSMNYFERIYPQMQDFACNRNKT